MQKNDVRARGVVLLDRGVNFIFRLFKNALTRDPRLPITRINSLRNGGIAVRLGPMDGFNLLRSRRLAICVVRWPEECSRHSEQVFDNALRRAKFEFGSKWRCRCYVRMRVSVVPDLMAFRVFATD